MVDKKRKDAYDQLYKREMTTTVNVRLNRKTDSDLLRNLESVPNKQGLIKDLLRQYFDTKAPNEEQ